MKVVNKIKSIFSKAALTGGLIVSAGLDMVWPDRDYRVYAKETYMKNVIAYRCIDLIAKSIISADWELQSIADDGTISTYEDRDFNAILKRANPRQSFMSLLYELTAHLVMTGNVFIQKVGPTSGNNSGKVKELYVLRPDRMRIVVIDGVITGYEYTINSKNMLFPVDPITGESQILHIKLFNPESDIWGMGAVEPTAREIDTMNSMIGWNKALIDNSARPGMVFMTNDRLGEEQWIRLRKDLRDGREGANNAGRSLILENAKDVKPYGYSPSEMDWIEGNREQARRISFGFGTPPQLVGIPGDSTYSNYREARSAFWEDTVLFYLNIISAELSVWLFNNTIELVYNIDNVPAMQYKKDLLWERAQKATFLSINEKRIMVGYDEIPNGNVILVPTTTTTLDFVTGDGFNLDEDEESVDIDDYMQEGKLMGQVYNDRLSIK